MQEKEFTLQLVHSNGTNVDLPRIHVRVAPSPQPLSLELWHGDDRHEWVAGSPAESTTSQASFEISARAGQEVRLHVSLLKSSAKKGASACLRPTLPAGTSGLAVNHRLPGPIII